MRTLATIFPQRRWSGATVALAALAFVAAMAVGVALHARAERLRIALAGRQVTLAVSAADPAQQAAHAGIVATMLRARADLRDIRTVPDAAVRAEAGDGPAPALIDATLAPGADEAPLTHALAGVPGVSVTRAFAGSDAAPRRIAAVAKVIVALALAGAFAAGIAEAHGVDDTALALLERLGATDSQRIGAVTVAAVPPLAIRSVIGCVIAIPFIAWQARAAEAESMQALGISGWAIVALAPLATAAIGALGVALTTAIDARRRP